MIEFGVEPNTKHSELLTDEYTSFLTTFCQQILNEFECDQRSVSILACNNEFITNLNKDFRDKEYATDVLSFAFDDDEEFILPNSALGEIIISIDKTISQAKEYEVTFDEEFARLSIHGLLHLLGYDHELGEEEHKEMFELQDEYMLRFMKTYNGSTSALI